MDKCPICRSALSAPATSKNDVLDVSCLNCSPFRLTGTALAMLERGFAPIERAKISHGLFGRGHSPVNSDTLNELSSMVTLPSAAGLIDNLVLYVAEETGTPGGTIHIRASEWRARLGACNTNGVTWAVNQAVSLGYLAGKPSPTLNPDEFQMINAHLELAGWQRVEELQRQAKDSKKAFMAMKFGEPDLDEIFRKFWIPAVSATGFRLRRLDDEPVAGLIDDRLRLEIRTSRFLLADLTHANAGAYWEAGYAEGLGRPVIYLCRRDVFDKPETRPHFDTNHHLTVIWDPEHPERSAKELKTVIRATLPSEAILEDDAGE